MLALAGVTSAAEPTGWQASVKIKEETRLDWEFVAGKEAERLPRTYDSRKQRYQLFVPPTYKPGKGWPLVVFVPPGDDPLGWRAWGKTCEDGDVLFCAPYGAGNSSSQVLRVRILLDALHDVRRRYDVDPDRTYLAGFSGGERVAATVAFALPEYFGGVIAAGGDVPLPRFDHLRHRAQDRLSVALVTGANAARRPEVEDYLAPLLGDLRVRARAWVVPKAGHALPPPDIVAEVHAWLDADAKRRAADAKGRPGLAVPVKGVVLNRAQAARALERAEADLKVPERTYRAVAQLDWIAARFAGTDSARAAKKRAAEVRADARAARLLAEQAGAEDRAVRGARARALERSGRPADALDAWAALAKAYPDSADKAAAEVKRLRAVLARTPYLGARLEGDTAAVAEVVPGGPAHRAGLRGGDRLVQVGRARLESPAELRAALRARKPGDKLVLGVLRGGKPVTLTVVLGRLPAPEKE